MPVKVKEKSQSVSIMYFEHITTIFKCYMGNLFEVLTLIDWEAEDLWDEIKEVVKDDNRSVSQPKFFKRGRRRKRRMGEGS